MYSMESTVLKEIGQWLWWICVLHIRFDTAVCKEIGQWLWWIRIALLTIKNVHRGTSGLVFDVLQDFAFLSI